VLRPRAEAVVPRAEHPLHRPGGRRWRGV